MDLNADLRLRNCLLGLDRLLDHMIDQGLKMRHRDPIAFDASGLCSV